MRVLVGVGDKKWQTFFANKLSREKISGDVVIATTSEFTKKIVTSQPSICIIHESFKTAKLSNFIEVTTLRFNIPILFVHKDIDPKVFYNIQNEIMFYAMHENEIERELIPTLKIFTKISPKISLLDKKIKKISNDYRDFQIITKAKYKLINDNKLSEDEAHRYIGKVAMNERITKRKAAEKIISS